MRDAGINVCCGGIVGMGETRAQRAGLIAQLANLDPYPESVPINNLVQVEGTPLAGTEPLDPFEFVRTIAVARITMPKTHGAPVGRARADGRGAAGAVLPRRRQLDLLRRRLLTTGNPQAARDRALLERLGHAKRRLNPHPQEGKPSPCSTRS